MTRHHVRNTAKDEYEVEFKSSGPMYFVGNREATAVTVARKMLAVHGVDRVRLYHTHPSPGPVRRYVGVVTASGLQRAG